MPSAAISRHGIVDIGRIVVPVAKRGARLAAREAMQKWNYDPLDVLVLHAQDAATSQATKLEIAQVLLPYLYPKLQNVTVDGQIEATVSAESQSALLRRVLENPELADAAQRLSLAAAEAALECDFTSNGTTYFDGNDSTVQ
jgi:hypothetical protein